MFKKHYDAEYLTLIVYVFMEMLKGEESFWYPYFQVINTCDLPMTWSEEDLAEFQDVVLKTTLINYRGDFEDEWLLVFDCAKKN